MLCLSWFLHRNKNLGALIIFLLTMTGGLIHFDVIASRDLSPFMGSTFKIQLLENRGYGGYIAAVRARLADSVWVSENRKIYLFLDDDKLKKDSWLVAEGTPRLLSPDGSKSTVWITYLKSQHINFSMRTTQFGILPMKRTFIQDIRNNVEERISRVLPDQVNRGLFTGILLGNKKGIPDHITEDFQRIGGMHVLAVSGLHVSVIYLVLRILLFPLPDYPHIRYGKLILLIVLLWIYAGITGNTSSVTRAVTFFSIFSVAELSGRRAFLYHILPLTAIFMWMYDPMDVFTIGFQLSFGAVLGIMVFQTLFDRMLTFLSRIPRYFFQLLTVSVSAQAFTWPLIIYYFGGISLGGIIFSTILIPMVFIIIVLGMVTLILYQVPIAGDVLTIILRFVLNELHTFSGFAADHTFYLSDLPRPFILFGILNVILLLLFLHRRSKQLLFILLVAAIALNSIPIFHTNRKNGLTLSARFGLSFSEYGITRHKPGWSDKRMELYKLGSNRIFSTRSVIPEGLEAGIIILDGNVKPVPVTGRPIIVVTHRVPYTTRQEWKKWSECHEIKLHDLSSGRFNL